MKNMDKFTNDRSNWWFVYKECVHGTLNPKILKKNKKNTININL